MCPGIRPATGWIAYLTSTPPRFEELGQLADGVLGLGHREAVARHDDHRLRIGELDRDVVGADLADGPTGAGDRPGRLVAATEPADHDVQDRAVHRVGHQLGQDRAGRADEGARDDQDRVASTKPAIAAAVPVNEFSRLMTTGMSAPPIGRTIVTPKTRPASTTRARGPESPCCEG